MQQDTEIIIRGITELASVRWPGVAVRCIAADRVAVFAGTKNSSHLFFDDELVELREIYLNGNILICNIAIRGDLIYAELPVCKRSGMLGALLEFPLSSPNSLDLLLESLDHFIQKAASIVDRYGLHHDRERNAELVQAATRTSQLHQPYQP